MSELTEFLKLGRSASYHYADDSGKEWKLGDKDKKLALEIFDKAGHTMHRHMREQADFLWSFKTERPE